MTHIPSILIGVCIGLPLGFVLALLAKGGDSHVCRHDQPAREPTKLRVIEGGSKQR